MAKIDLDFVSSEITSQQFRMGNPRRRTGGVLAWFGVAASLSLSVLLTIELWTAGAVVTELETEYENRARAPATGQQTKPIPEITLSPAQVLATNASIEQLNIPWRSIFMAVERAAANKVAFLALEPDARKRTLRITAETKNVDAMLDFATRLQAQAKVDAVKLLNHEVNTQDPNQPIRFQADMQWSTSTP
jgi:hypothetical protein